MNPAEIARQAAAQTVRQQLGLSASPLDWTYEQRLAYNKALAAYLLAHPVGLDSETLRQASAVTNAQYTPLADTSFDWVQFGDEFTNNAGKLATGFAANLSKVAAVALVIVALFFVVRHSPPPRR